MTIAGSYVKQPSEQETIKIDWSKRAASLVVSGYAISTVTVAIYDSAGVDVSDDELGPPIVVGLLKDIPSFLGTDLFFTVKAGESGQDYDAKITVTLTKGGYVDQIQEEDLKIVVREKSL